MDKHAFLDALKVKLSGVPRKEVEERLSFYEEIIDDRIEEGLTEEDAVKEIGTVEEVVEAIIADLPFSKIVKEKIKPKRRIRVWEIVLLVLGSPVWVSLLVAACAVLFSLYAVLWSVIVSLWAVFVVAAAVAFAGLVLGIAFLLQGIGLSGGTLIGGGLICVGMAIFLVYGCNAATKGMLVITKRIAFLIKKSFVKREGAQ